MDIVFKDAAKDHIIQSGVRPKCYKGLEVCFNGEVVAVVDDVVGDEVIMKVKPGFEGKLLEAIQTPAVSLGVANCNCAPRVAL